MNTAKLIGEKFTPKEQMPVNTKKVDRVVRLMVSGRSSEVWKGDVIGNVENICTALQYIDEFQYWMREWLYSLEDEAKSSL